MTPLRRILSRDFLVIFVSHFLFSVVFGSLLPAFPLFLARAGYGDARIGILTGVFAVAAVALRPLAGAALNRFSAKRVIVAGALLYGLSFPALLSGTAFWLLLAARLAQGAAFALVTTASTAAVVDISPAALRGRSLGDVLLSVNIATAVGPALGIFFINIFSFGPFFVGLALLCLSSAAAILALRTHGAPAARFPLRLNDFFSRAAVPSGLACFGVQLIWGTVSTFFPLSAVEKGVANPGLFFTAMSVTMVLCRTLGARVLDLVSGRAIIMTFLALQAADLLLLSVVSTQAMFVLVGVIFGLCYAYLIPSFMAHATRDSEASSGAAVGTFLGLGDAGLALGPAVMGAVASGAGYPVTFLCAALIACADLAYSKIFIRERMQQSTAGG